MFGVTDIEGYSGDREFPSKDDFKYLADKGILFTIRLKKNTKINGKQAENLLHGMAHGEVRIMEEKQKVLDQELYISVTVS